MTSLFDVWCSVNYAGITISVEEFYNLPIKRIMQMLDWLNKQKKREQEELEK